MTKWADCRDIFGYNAILCAMKAKSIECVEAIRRAGGIIDLSEKKIGEEADDLTVYYSS